jgi:hypothetical protein
MFKNGLLKGHTYDGAVTKTHFTSERRNSMARKIKVKFNTRKSHSELANDAVAVCEGLRENHAFPPNPPIALDVFKAAIDAYLSSITAAADGSRRAMAERNKLKEDVVSMMRQLGHWVEANCRQDPAVLKSSGFPAASTARVAQGRLPQPVILKTQHGSVSGQMFVQVTPLARARNYELRYATNGADGKPGEWTLLPPFASSRISVTELTPGVAYRFQVRAFGKAGLTDWSDAASRIAI